MGFQTQNKSRWAEIKERDERKNLELSAADLIGEHQGTGYVPQPLSVPVEGAARSVVIDVCKLYHVLPGCFELRDDVQVELVLSRKS